MTIQEGNGLQLNFTPLAEGTVVLWSKVLLLREKINKKPKRASVSPLTQTWVMFAFTYKVYFGDLNKLVELM